MQVILMLAALVAQPANVTAVPEIRAQPSYDEERIGSWVLRSDTKAKTYGVIWADSGVIELSAASSDGKVQFVVRDNGARLNAWLGMPKCSISPHEARYPGAKKAPTLLDFAEDIRRGSGCALGTYELEVSAWIRDFPRALEAMKSRAQAMYGRDINRCEVPRPRGRKFRPPPPHPPCGSPPPEIGENHAP